VGKTIEQVIGINPILSKEQIFNNLNDTRQELLEKIGLTFNEFGEVVVGYVDIENYITLFVSRSGVQSAVTTPNNSIIIMDYTDGLQWLKWSRHFTGETSVREDGDEVSCEARWQDSKRRKMGGAKFTSSRTRKAS